jgi:peptidoglycan L-alanyl-D-glutamate endopeptidase CwlK
MGFRLGSNSRAKLFGVKPDLKRVVARALELSKVDFTVLEGKRTLERQQVLFDEGKSQTMNSRHLTGHAVDLGAWVDGTVSWEWEHYEHIAAAMKTAADELGFEIEWGGDWKTLKDGPHFQLSWKARSTSAEPKPRQRRKRSRRSRSLEKA